MTKVHKGGNHHEDQLQHPEGRAQGDGRDRQQGTGYQVRLLRRTEFFLQGRAVRDHEGRQPLLRRCHRRIDCARVCTALREAGFMSEDGENEASCVDTGEDKPIQTEAAEDELAAVETAEIEPSQTEAVEDNVPVQMEMPAEVTAMEEAVAATDEDSLSISLPRTLFTEMALQNLDALLLSKGRLIRHAFDIREATYTLTDDRITFAWLHGTITDETAKAYAEFISKLCLMARTQKRVTAKEKIVDNEKYAFRFFLLRLGMIGNAYKESRKILLQNLIGSSAF